MAAAPRLGDRWALSGIPFGGLMTAFAAWQRRRDQQKTGAVSSGPLERAMRDGQLPVDPEQAHEMARLVARRRKQHRLPLVINPPLLGALAALGIAYGVLTLDWGLVACRSSDRRRGVRDLHSAGSSLPA